MSEIKYVITSTGDDSVKDSDTPKDDVRSISQRLGEIGSDRLKLMIEEGLLIEKGLNSDDPETIIKAQSQWEDVQNRESSGLKSDLVDPNAITYSVGYKYKSASLSYEILRKMSRTPIIRSIIGTRQAQISAFAQPQREKYDTGFIVRKKREHYSKDEPKMTKSDKAEQQRITEFLLNCGEDSNKWHGDTFDQFLKKITEDSLSLDQGTFEIARNRMGQPVEFAATDAATMRIADSIDDDAYHNKDKVEKHGYLPSYVQVIDGQIKNEYYPWELCFGIRNASTDIHSNGYGRSELEDLINIVTWMLFGDEYNGRFFSQGSSPKGMLKVAKGTNRSKIQEFRQQWMSMVAGVMNAWKVPIIESDEMEWIDLQKNNTDMQFSVWQEYLIKIACAVYKIAPEEVGFNLGNASGGGSALFEGSKEQEIKYSRDKGLKPLLKNIQFWINKWIVNPLNPQWEFVFAGLDVADEDKELDRDIQAVSNFEGLREVRRRRGLPDNLEEGDLILNAQFMQKWSQEQMAGEQQANGEAIEQDGMSDEDSYWDSGEEDEDSYDYKDAWDSLDFNKGLLADLKGQGNPMMNNLLDWFDKEVIKETP